MLRNLYVAVAPKPSDTRIARGPTDPSDIDKQETQNIARDGCQQRHLHPNRTEH